MGMTRTSTRSYDSIGRILDENGPLVDTAALDKTTTAYYASYDGSWPGNFGRVQSVTKYVGTSASNTPLTTTYAQYDIFGVPHLVTGPNGDQVTYSPSSDRLTWTVTQVGIAASSTVSLNADGTVRSMLDPDGCLYDLRI